MKAARVTQWGSPPEYIDIPDLPPPSPTQLQLQVVAAGVPRAVKGRAARKHPSAYDAPLPFDPSADGVGVDGTGDLYYINTLAAPLFAERANVERDQIVKLPPDTNPILVAGLSNNVASSWMALRCRAGGCEGHTVAILGVTSFSGRSAALVARLLGATRIIGISRNLETLNTVEGLDERVLLSDPLDISHVGPVDIVLDYVGGPAAIHLLQTVQIRSGGNLQYIQTGGLAGFDHLNIPARLINIKPICIMASGVGSLTQDDLKREMALLAAALAGISTGEVEIPFEIVAAPMRNVHEVWDSEESQNKRLVLVP